MGLISLKVAIDVFNGNNMNKHSPYSPQRIYNFWVVLITINIQ